MDALESKCFCSLKWEALYLTETFVLGQRWVTAVDADYLASPRPRNTDILVPVSWPLSKYRAEGLAKGLGIVPRQNDAADSHVKLMI